MIEVRGNLWTFPADIRVITTNGSVKKNGEAVMGRGCAKEATEHYLGCAKMLGSLIKDHGNHCHIIFRGNFVNQMPLVSFPVKHRWHEMADKDLILRSAEELVDLADDQAWVDGWKKVVLPRPGCGNGRLQWCWCKSDWEEGVECGGIKHVLENILDDRFHVITFDGDTR